MCNLYLCEFDIVIEVLILFLWTHTVDWLNLILLKTNGEEQVTLELCLAWSLIIQFLSPASKEQQSWQAASSSPSFSRIDNLTGVATSLLVTCLPPTLLSDLSACDSNMVQRCHCCREFWHKNQPFYILLYFDMWVLLKDQPDKIITWSWTILHCL